MRTKIKAEFEFIGGMAEHVTNSCTRIKYRDKTILVDMGLSQGDHTVYSNYVTNRDFLKKIKPKTINAVVVTHLHADHCALIPWLFKNGDCNAKVYVSKNSCGIMKEMLLDSARIMERDTQLLSEQKNKYFEPFFTIQDVETTLKHVVEVEPIDEHIEVSDGVTLTFYPNSHILLSQQAELLFDTVPVKKRVLFTGDLGNLNLIDYKFYIERFHPVERAQYVISESTYGLLDKRDIKKDLNKDIEKMESVIRQFCQDNNGRVLIPTFSLDRCVLYMNLLYKIFKDDDNFNIPILIDSPLTNKLLDCYGEIFTGEISDEYEKIRSWKNFKYIINPEDSKSAILDNQPKVILSSSGMLTQGRSIYWIKSILPRENDCCLIAGYTGDGTLGNKIKECKTNKTITIQGKQYPNKCSVVNIRSFSGHMQNCDLIRYLTSIKCEKIFLVHGDAEAKTELKRELERVFKDNYLSTKVVSTNKSTKFTLT